MNGEVGAVVLCGGASLRMGRAKAWLPFGDETMLQRTVRVLARCCTPLVVVAAPGQRLPPLSVGHVVRDPVRHRGPLQGIAVGLSALVDEVPRAFVCATDLPLLRPALVAALSALAAEHEIVVPHSDGHHHALAALYNTSLGARARVLLNDGERRARALFEEADTRTVSANMLLKNHELRAADANLDSLRNVNTMAEYVAALRLMGLPLPSFTSSLVG